MLSRLVLLLSIFPALVACAPSRTTPAEVCFYGEYVYHHSDQAGVVCPRADHVSRLALAACPQPRRARLLSDLSKVDIDVFPAPLWCQRWVVGCQDGLDIKVTSLTVIADELGHLAWEDCFDRTGEKTEADGSVQYDADFAAFVESTNE